MPEPEYRPGPAQLPEILAPAGDEAMLRAAVFSGADCVYVGLAGFNARRGAGNFTGEALRQAVAFCHARGCGVYAAVNTLALPGQQAAFAAALEDAARAGCDALIVQDLSAAALARRVAPGVPLHASTQMSIHSPAGAQMLQQLGFTRAILARELSRADIAAIHAACPTLELEIFVHGALCVSVSGQCFYSAQLGGRSANRGACASPCRLRAALPGGAKAGGEHLLSLKDLSILQALPELTALGVCSAKIEGRLRGPEYAAAVVDAARKARAGQPYDAAALREVFSRSGFTGGWYTGEGGGGMFGRRTEADESASRRALPAARALYRREGPRVPVWMRLTLAEAGGSLTAGDGVRQATVPIAGPLPPAQTDAAPALARALGKTGGTPFFVPEGGLQLETEGRFLAGSGAAEARRAVLEELLRRREAEGNSPLWPRSAPQPPPPLPSRPAPALTRRPGVPAGVRLGAFAALSALPPNAGALFDELVLPLFEWRSVPEALRPISWLAFPRVLFGSWEGRAAAEAAEAAEAGFLGFEANNLAHFALVPGQPLRGGFGLNISNAAAAREAAALGAAALTLSFELSLAQLRALVREAPPNLRLDALCYGRLPFVLTRACPLQGAGQRCQGCPQRGELAGRKGAPMPLRCRHGVREVYNPVPLWMADRLSDWPCEGAVQHYFTETAAEAAQTAQAFAEGRPAEGPFTRGLYDHGTEGA